MHPSSAPRKKNNNLQRWREKESRKIKRILRGRVLQVLAKQKKMPKIKGDLEKLLLETINSPSGFPPLGFWTQKLQDALGGLEFGPPIPAEELGVHAAGARSWSKESRSTCRPSFANGQQRGAGLLVPLIVPAAGRRLSPPRTWLHGPARAHSRP